MLTDTRCTACGHELTGIPRSANCPECGRPAVMSRLIADRNRIGRDDRASLACAAARWGLLLHGAMLIYAMTLAFPGWLVLPVGIASDAFHQATVIGTAWLAATLWIVAILSLRQDCIGASRWWWLVVLSAPIVDATIRTIAVSQWSWGMAVGGGAAVGPPPPMLIAAAAIAPGLAGLAMTIAVERPVRPVRSAAIEPRGPRGRRRLRAALLFLWVMGLLTVAVEGFGLVMPILGAGGGTITRLEGLVLFAQALVCGALARRMLFVVSSVGGRADVDVIPSAWRVTPESDMAIERSR